MNKRFLNKVLLLLWSLCFCVIGSINATDSFKLGIENVLDLSHQRLFDGKRIGLITNQTGVDQTGRRNVDLLREVGFNVVYLLGPEHGINGKAGSEVEVADSVDKKTTIPVVSLYGNGSGKLISAEVMNNIDLLMFDIQDSGMRHYTYISTLLHAMRQAGKYDKQIVVLDRPNPLGANMEGPVVQKDLKSFISIAQIPLRHGMTIGELAWYFNEHELQNPVKLHVVKMSNYDRYAGLSGQLLVPPSSGLRTIQSCYGYSFLGLLGEIKPFGIGLRTPGSYHSLALRDHVNVQAKVWSQLRAKLKTYGIESVAHEYIDPKVNKRWRGLRLHIADINKVQSFKVLVVVLAFFKSVGVKLSFSRVFDKAVGTRTLREFLEGKQSYETLAFEVNEQLGSFFKKARNAFMYEPAPVPILVK